MFEKEHGEVVASGNVIGIEFDGFVETSAGGIGLAGLGETDAEEGEGLRGGRGFGKGLFEDIGGFREITLLVEGDALLEVLFGGTAAPPKDNCQCDEDGNFSPCLTHAERDNVSVA